MTFLETPRFPETISYGASGGPGYDTDIIVVNSGYESSNANWDVARASYDVSHGIKLQTDMDTLVAFFRNCKGRAHGFRFKDWLDYTVTHSNGVLTAGIGTGLPTYQLYKKYTTGALTESRAISKPVVSSAEIKRNGSAVTFGAGAGQIAIDTATGIITFVADSSKTINANVTASINANVSANITAITQANPGVVTAVAHGFATGDVIRIDSVVGMTQVNNLYFTIIVLTADTFSIGVNSTAYTAYSSGGTAIKYGATQTNAVRINCTAHAFINGDIVYIAAAGGMTQINNLSFTVVNSATNYFELTGINGTAYTLYTSGGTVTKYGATKTSPVRIYSTAHGFSNGNVVYITGVVGMTEINSLAFTVANSQTNYFELSGINGSAYTLRTSGGTISKYPQAADTLTWSGEFDVPCRFDTDQMKVSIEFIDNYNWGGIPIVEIRI